jgi:hypothetical protein
MCDRQEQEGRFVSLLANAHAYEDVMVGGVEVHEVLHVSFRCRGQWMSCR